MSMISSQCDELGVEADELAMEDREFPCSVHVNESTGRLEVRTDTKVHVYSESENQMIIDTVVRLGDENAKLRELVRKWYPHMLKRVGRDALEQWGQMDVVRELRIEVGE